MCIYIYTHMCLKMSVHLSVVYVCLPACVSVVLSIYLSICLSIYLYLSICRSVHLSVSICFYLRSKDHRSSTDHITDPTHIVNMCESLYVYVSSCLSICLSSVLASDAHDAATACNIEKTYIHRDRQRHMQRYIACLSISFSVSLSPHRGRCLLVCCHREKTRKALLSGAGLTVCRTIDLCVHLHVYVSVCLYDLHTVAVRFQALDCHSCDFPTLRSSRSLVSRLPPCRTATTCRQSSSCKLRYSS